LTWTIVPNQQGRLTRVTTGGAPVLVATDTFLVTGSPFQVTTGAGITPRPCIRVLWPVPAGRVQVQGTPVLLSWSTGICLSAGQIPQGSPVVVSVQQRVSGQ
jgi:hypothetical protein